MIEKYALKQNISLTIIENTDYFILLRIEIDVKNLQSLNGLHKIVRISPFGKGDKVHTSLAKVKVFGPKPTYKIHIEEKDLRMDFFKSTGPGGQHKNKTLSAVRIVHIPTGIMVTSSAERSQNDNKKYAYEQLYCKLSEIMEANNKQQFIKERKEDLQNETIVASYYLNHQLAVHEIEQKKTKNVKDLMNGNLQLIFQM